MPIRLVQENGDTIPLDATSIDIVVERSQSNFGIPFFDAKNIGFDLNMASFAVEIQGVLANEEGQEASAQATASIDFDQPQQLNTGPQLIGGGGTGTGTGLGGGFVASSFASTGVTQNVSIGGGMGAATGMGSGGNSISAPPVTVTKPQLGNKILNNWNGKYLKLPVGFWVERATTLDHPVKSGLQMWLKADVLADTLEDGDAVSSWGDSSGNARHVVQASSGNQPIYKENGANGMPYVKFDGSDDFLSYAYDSSNSPFLNPDVLTIFTVTTDITGMNGGILSSRNGNDGYYIKYDNSNTRFNLGHHNTTASTANGSRADLNYPSMLTIKTSDTGDGDTLWDTVQMSVDGEISLASTGSKTYTKNTSGAFDVGRESSSYLNGYIHEILVYNTALTNQECEKVEGYLSRKYGINLTAGHKYAGAQMGNSQYSYNNKHVKVVFDKDLVGSRKEPFGFMNTGRPTGLKITNVSGGTLTITSSNPTYGELEPTNNPQSWFEVTNSDKDYEIIFINPSNNQPRGGNFFSMLKGKVLSVSSSQIVVEYNIASGGADPPQNDDEIWINPFKYEAGGMYSNSTKPVIVVPIKNADTFDEDALADKAVGPNFPLHQDGATTRAGNTNTRTDEYIAFLMQGALTSNYLNGMEAVDSSGNVDMGSVFDVVIVTGTNGNLTRLNITQKHATSLGALANTIENSMPEGIMPDIQGFTGGRSGEKVKSGGDKVQDILGILANSNNFGLPDRGNIVERLHNLGAGFFQDVMYRGTPSTKGDYIEGIQIPYTSKTTFGQSTFDTNIAQRNFFLTTEDNTAGKLATINGVHANRAFSSSADGHLRNGIKGMVMDFNVQRDAEMKAYDFSLKFVAADIIL